ncbi:MAG: hypothetical protein HBSAPP03_11330 [Phycisphaerae bacterium]|nr:MAG: hypothetical protein HBSAPP03_11330 [Phycisphaerae bacterium]
MVRRLVKVVVAGLSLAGIAGCYKQTVSTSGIGSYGSDVQPSRRSNTAADRWIDSLFAPPKTTTRSHWVER